MKNLLLSTALSILSISILTSQSTPQFIIAGDANGLVPHASGSLTLTQGGTVFGTSNFKIDSLDLNSDGIFDVSFDVFVCNTFDCNGSYTEFYCNHNGSSYVFGQPNQIKQYAEGDTIWFNNTWDFNLFPHRSGSFAINLSGLGGIQKTGEWLNSNTGYMAIMLATPQQDTLYGWMKVFSYAHSSFGGQIKLLEWAFMHDPNQKPYAAFTVSPEKPVYCMGDSLTIQATLLGADHFDWKIGSDSLPEQHLVTWEIPSKDSLKIRLTAVNSQGSTVVENKLPVSPLEVSVEDITLTCLQPTAEIQAITNVPANLFLIIGNDTFPFPQTPVFPFGGEYRMLAVDQNNCTDIEDFSIFEDINSPSLNLDIIEFQGEILLQAYIQPGILLYWEKSGVVIDSFINPLVVSESGEYTAVAVGPNGCISTATIIIELSAAEELSNTAFSIFPNPASEKFRFKNGSQQSVYVSIYDGSGRKMGDWGDVQPQSEVEFNIDRLSPGYYLLKVLAADNKVLLLKKFVKN